MDTYIMDVYCISAWLLSAIIHTQKENSGAELIDIISYTDYSNHAILTYEELKSAIHYLMDIKLIAESGKKFFITEITAEWFNEKYSNKKRSYPQREFMDIEKFIRKMEKIPLHSILKKKSQISEKDLDEAIHHYLKRPD